VTDDRPHVLIAFDGSDEARHAIDVAATLMPGARATVVTVRDSWNPLEHAAVARLALPDSIIAPATRRLADALAEVAAATAADGAATATAAGLTVAHHVEDAPKPWRGLVAVAHRLSPDVIICGARGRGRLSRAVLGTTTDSLLHHAPAPLLIVPRADRAVDGPVLVGYDGSAPARGAIELAARLFPRRRAEVVNAWSSPFDRSFEGEEVTTMPLVEMAEIVEAVEGKCAETAQMLADEGAVLARTLELDAHAMTVPSGVGAWHALTSVAEERHAAVIVVGSRGRGAIASTVLGSVSAGLAHNAACPIVISRRRECSQATRATDDASSTSTQTPSSTMVTS